jgi:hypothetical protein
VKKILIETSNFNAGTSEIRDETPSTKTECNPKSSLPPVNAALWKNVSTVEMGGSSGNPVVSFGYYLWH